MNCNCDKSKSELAKETLHKLSVEQQDAIHFHLVETRKLQELLWDVMFMLIGIMLGVCLGALMVLQAMA